MLLALVLLGKPNRIGSCHFFGRYNRKLVKIKMIAKFGMRVLDFPVLISMGAMIQSYFISKKIVGQVWFRLLLSFRFERRGALIRVRCLSDQEFD